MLSRVLATTTGARSRLVTASCSFAKINGEPTIRSSTALRSFTSKPTALTPEERQTALSKLQSASGPFPWQETTKGDSTYASEPAPSALTKTYHFLDFNQAWSFMSRVALLAEKMDHHPEWFNVYNRVEVTLSTHDCGGVSKKDFKMAQKMDEYATSLLSSPIKQGNGT